MASCIEDRYVHAAGGARVSAALRRSSLTECVYGPDLATLLTGEAQAEVPDRHLQVRWSDEELAVSSVSQWDDPEYLAAYWRREDLNNQGLEKVERLPGNVGLLVLKDIDEPAGTSAVVDAAFAFLARCSALIVDLRRTTGGAPTGVAHLLGPLLPPGTPLIEVVNRAGDVVERTQTAPDRDVTLSANVPVYVLVGPRTVSGCEELAYDLRAAQRATLVGATTLGAANPVDSFVVDPHFLVRVPTAFVRHTVTDGNWEGDGIRPDLRCDPEDALTVAHRLAARNIHDRIQRRDLTEAEGLLDELGMVLTDP